MSIDNQDTIAAIATPIGEGAIAVIRVSGRDAVKVVGNVFAGSVRLSMIEPWTIHHGWIVNQDGERIDEVLLSFFRHPHSYTGEDLVEVSCHGGLFSSRSVLETILRSGARQARPGEFTLRRFLNGRTDLAGAEAAADVISSRSKRSLRSSIAHLRGELSARVAALRSQLIEICGLVELELDFAEEGIQLMGRSELARRLDEIEKVSRGLRNTYESGRIIKEGARVVIAGRPNAGKSSVFNRLLELDRSIVSSIEGTTRDFIEESITIDGLTVALVDTAGLRDSADPVESEGVRRTKENVETADLVVYVCDLSIQSEPDVDVLAKIAGPLIILLNKADLCGLSAGAQVREDGVPCIRGSAKTGSGFTELRSIIGKSITERGMVSEEGVLITNVRHKQALNKGLEAIARGQRAIAEEAVNEVIALELREAANRLGEITGEVTTDEILDGIFKRFCIGK